MSAPLAREIEALLTCGVVAVLVAMTTALGGRLMVSSGLSEVSIRARAAQLADVEHFALTGRWSSSGEALSGPSASEAARDRQSEMTQLGVAFRAPMLRSALELPAAGGGNASTWPALGKVGGQNGKPNAVRSGVVDGAIVVVGRFGQAGSTFSSLVRPAVQRNDAPMAAAWVCGQAAPGPAWVTAALPPGADSWNDLRTYYWCPSEALQ